MRGKTLRKGGKMENIKLFKNIILAFLLIAVLITAVVGVCLSLTASAEDMPLSEKVLLSSNGISKTVNFYTSDDSGRWTEWTTKSLTLTFPSSTPTFAEIQNVIHSEIWRYQSSMGEEVQRVQLGRFSFSRADDIVDFSLSENIDCILAVPNFFNLIIDSNNSNIKIKMTSNPYPLSSVTTSGVINVPNNYHISGYECAESLSSSSWQSCTNAANANWYYRAVFEEDPHFYVISKNVAEVGLYTKIYVEENVVYDLAWFDKYCGYEDSYTSSLLRTSMDSPLSGTGTVCDVAVGDGYIYIAEQTNYVHVNLVGRIDGKNILTDLHKEYIEGTVNSYRTKRYRLCDIVSYDDLKNSATNSMLKLQSASIYYDRLISNTGAVITGDFEITEDITVYADFKSNPTVYVYTGKSVSGVDSYRKAVFTDGADLSNYASGIKVPDGCYIDYWAECSTADGDFVEVKTITKVDHYYKPIFKKLVYTVQFVACDNMGETGFMSYYSYTMNTQDGAQPIKFKENEKILYYRCLTQPFWGTGNEYTFIGWTTQKVTRKDWDKKNTDFVLIDESFTTSYDTTLYMVAEYRDYFVDNLAPSDFICDTDTTCLVRFIAKDINGMQEYYSYLSEKGRTLKMPEDDIVFYRCRTTSGAVGTGKKFTFIKWTLEYCDFDDWVASKTGYAEIPIDYAVNRSIDIYMVATFYEDFFAQYSESNFITKQGILGAKVAEDYDTEFGNGDNVKKTWGEQISSWFNGVGENVKKALMICAIVLGLIILLPILPYLIKLLVFIVMLPIRLVQSISKAFKTSKKNKKK